MNLSTHEQHAQSPPNTKAQDDTMRVVLFTDTLADINGVSRFIQNMGEQAQTTGRELAIFTSTEKTCPEHLECVRNFAPLHAMPMPGYPELDLAIPPAISMIRTARQLQPDVIHISTPGPVGTIGLLTSKLLRKPALGVYHTDFPAFLDQLFASQKIGRVCEHTMGLFYKRFHTVFARSDAYIDSVRRLGIANDRIATFPSGIDVDLFHPSNRDTSVWNRLRAKDEIQISNDSVKFVFVGRVSVEKNTPLLATLWPAIHQQCQEQSIHAELIVIGDGPARTELEQTLQHLDTHFLGYRHGQELSQLYASCDVFLFTSITDTLGQVVMEAQASGLPALVTDQGGPKTTVRHLRTGFVLPVEKQERWIAHAVQLATEPTLRHEMGAAARAAMEDRSIEKSFERFWNEHEKVWHEQPQVYR